MIYAVGDIHGALDKLKAAHERIEADMARHGSSDATVVHVGDLVDRGPDSAGVVDYLLNTQRNKANYITLMGNHDRMFVTFVRRGGAQDPRLRKDLVWLKSMIGGKETLASYGVSDAALEDPAAALAEALERVPPEHLDFLGTLPCFHETATHYFAHAGIRPGVALSDQAEDDLVWIRGEFLDNPYPHPKVIVHGHTPVERIENMGNRVAIDTGAAYGGPLSAVVFDGKDVLEITRRGRVPVRVSDY